jgi:hypothetical protein
MLAIDSIKITDDIGNSYTINKRQLEFFPLVGGQDSNLISTKVFNQHGESYVNSYMNSDDGELNFVIHTEFMNEIEIEKARKDIVDIFNPLNGILRMTLFLNSGNSYYRDIVITNAPHFPIGFENRNNTWQRVQLFYRALNPFYYTLPEIAEDFNDASNRFEFPFSMSESDPVEFGVQMKKNIAVNYGQIEAPVRIIIKGSCVNPVITNVSTGEFIKFRDLQMGENDELYINTNFGEKKVTLNNFNVFHKLDFSSTFFSLKLGENEISFTDEGLGSTAQIYFYYRNLYVQI